MCLSLSCYNTFVICEYDFWVGAKLELKGAAMPLGERISNGSSNKFSS